MLKYFSINKPPILWKRGLLWLLFLGSLFFIGYYSINQFTSRRDDVGVVVSSWEYQLPFIAWLMLPYMSIDFFYAISLFMYRKRSLLDRHALRILLATIISFLGFLIFPLRFSFEVPRADGLSGYLQNLLLSFDQPYNQAPSLHISLLVILWFAYAKKMSEFWRTLLHIWFLMIGLSVLLVYQHHFVDVWTGFITGIVCLYIIPEPPFLWQYNYPTSRMKSLCLRYVLATAFLLVITFTLIFTVSYWFAILLWPVVSLSLIALSYAGFGKQVFQRLSGRMCLPARMLLMPYLLGAWFTHQFLLKNREKITKIHDKVWLGAFPHHNSRPDSTASWYAVLDMTNEFLNSPVNAQHKKYLPVLDLVSPLPVDLMRAVRWLDRVQREGHVLVHCALGLSRSAAVIVCWQVWRGDEDSAEGATINLNKLRSGIVLTQEHINNIQKALTLLGSYR